MEMPEVRKASEADRTAVLHTMTLAFVADPLMRWILPEAGDYLTHFPPMTDIFGGKSIDNGSCFMTTGGEGAAMWLPPGVSPDEQAWASRSEAALPEERLASFGQLLDAMESYHPDEDDCWYLSVIGVDSGHQGKGVGATLMKHVTRMLDDNGYLGYLESSNPQNISLYQRHGFEIVGEIQIDDSPVVTPMIRSRR